jgi:hypothetical protein
MESLRSAAVAGSNAAKQHIPINIVPGAQRGNRHRLSRGRTLIGLGIAGTLRCDEAWCQIVAFRLVWVCVPPDTLCEKRDSLTSSSQLALSLFVGLPCGRSSGAPGITQVLAFRGCAEVPSVLHRRIDREPRAKRARR